ncbi:MAG TPA: histidine phosphatase family protein [Salinivirgaceae bacterium]|nr:histidine phosphatase family protein [Salinivirgaceae bacterium]
MKVITLFRHGKAIEQSIDIPDFARVLRELGRNDVALMAQKLADKKIIPQLLVHSGAARTMETAQIINNHFQNTIPMQEEHWIYTGYTTSDFLDFIQSLLDEINSVCIVGHNPYISDVAHRLCKDFHASFPTSGNLTLQFDVPSWADIQPGKGKIVAFEYPKLYR